MICDVHCHIASLEHTPQSFIEGSIENVLEMMSARGIPATRKHLWKMYERKMQDALCDELVAEMDEAGISRAVLLAADFTWVLKDCALTIEETYQRHRAVMERHPGRLAVFAGVDPRWGKSGLDLFERSVREYGFSGMKLYPPCGYSPSDRAFDPYYELCSELRLPVMIHIGPTSPVLSSQHAEPFNVDEPANRFPRVRFILAHAAVNHVEECAMLARVRPNVYADISAFQLSLGWRRPAERLQWLLSQGINHKILFGTDWPVFRLQGSQKSFVEALTSENGILLDLPDVERDLILYKNAERILSRD
jgi:predicted TIM-barrel fold metal-dependent hydrolase